MTDTIDRPGPIDRMLRLFSDIRAGESGTALLLTGNVFLILSAYYVLKVVREALILGQAGAEIKSYSGAAQAVLLLAAVPLYGAVAARVPRRRLINGVTAFFVGCLALFWLLSRFDVPLAIAFFLWVGIFNVMIVAQFWAFANDIYTNEEGKRLFPIIGFGASAGAVAGSYLPNLLRALPLPTLFLLGAILLIGAAALTNVVDIRERRRTEFGAPDVLTSGLLPAATGQFRAATGQFKAVTDSEAYLTESGVGLPKLQRGQSIEEAEQAQLESTGGAFALVFRNRYLLLIAFLILLLNWVNTTGEYILGRTVQDAANALYDGVGTREAFVSAYSREFYSSFFTIVNAAGLVIQLFIVSRVLKYFGVRAAILVLPAIALIGYAMLAFIPILALVRWVKTAENATDYSLHNTVRNVLFLPTTREEKYKAKQAIDSFFWRAGDMLQAVLVYFGTTYLMFETRHFALVNMGLVVVWLGLAVSIGRRYARLAAATER
ncbi:MAG TPA: Npt1/Npt2 family nucleotide transporter [Gemmatimonadales bacterium]